MKKIIGLCLILLPLGVIAQSTDSIIRNVRAEYKAIVDNKEKYKKITINVPPQELYLFDGEGDEPYIEKIITYYLDKNEIKLISVSNEFTLRATLVEFIEYYLKNNDVFFIYQKYKAMGYPDNYEWETIVTKVDERRIYYNSNQLIKCLTKKVEGKLSEVDSLLQNTTNKEENCSQMRNVGNSLIYIFREENVNLLLDYYRKYNSKSQK